MYPPPHDHYDPYTGKFKRGPAAYGVWPRRLWTECGVCLVLLLMASTAVLGAVAAWVLLPNDRQPQTESAFTGVIPSSTPQDTLTAVASPPTLPPFDFIPTSTFAPTLTPFPSASPTSQVFIQASATSTPRRIAGLLLQTATPTAFLLPASPTPIRDRAESPGERFAFFAQNSNMPKLLTVTNIACDADHSDFTLVFDPTLDSNIPYLEVTLTTAGAEASFSEITPLVTAEMQILQDLTITLNETALNLNDIRSSQIFLSIIQNAWNRERLRGVTAFSITWTETSRQPAMSFRIIGQHPNAGGVMMTVRWARDPNQRLEDNDRPTFQVC